MQQKPFLPSTKPQDCATPRSHGGGDGIRQNASAKKRVPVSSARKFNPRTPTVEGLKLRLEKAMVTELARGCGTESGTPKRAIFKAASVAEITPTKSKRRLSLASTEDSCEIYATPRPLLRDEPRKTFCLQERHTCKLFRKLMLLAWRRTRDNLRDLKEVSKKYQNQVSQLEIQRDVLIKLRISESQKREETQAECQKLKNSVELLELENNQLSEETQNLQNNLEVLQNELKVAKAENNFLSEQSIKMQDMISRKKNEKIVLEQKVRGQDEEISAQKSIVSKQKENQLAMEKKLQTAELNYRIKEKKYAQLKCKFKNQLDSNHSYEKQLRSLEEEKANISFRVADLETQLNDYIRSCEVLREANEELSQEVRNVSLELEEEKKHVWFKTSKEFALLSLLALRKIVRVMVPAYLDGPTNF